MALHQAQRECPADQTRVGPRSWKDELMPGDADDGNAQLAQHVVECAQRTLAARGVKIDWRDESNFEFPPTTARWRRRKGGLLPLMGKLLWKTIKSGFKLAVHDVKFGALAAKGVLDPATGRFMIDFGSFAQVYDGENTYGGRSGRPIATLNPFRTPGRSHEVMWLLRMLGGTTDATKEGADVLHGRSCVRFAVHVDLERASTAMGGGLRAPGSVCRRSNHPMKQRNTLARPSRGGASYGDDFHAVAEGGDGA